MNIERDVAIKFHEQGTLNAVTRWISTHDEGLAEWLKNVRRAYQADRAHVTDGHRTGLLLLADGAHGEPARIGLLDVGGAALEDVTYWSTWQDPEASGRSSTLAEEETQGNGGKAYMFRLFTGPSRIIGIRDGKRNCKGFEGPPGSVERGTPGFIPSGSEGREVPIASVEAELRAVLAPYGLEVSDLPDEVRVAISSRSAFTLVEGVAPVGFFRERIDADELLWKTVRHEQSVLAFEQLCIYAMHNGVPLNSGKPLELPTIQPYPGLEGPFIYDIPTVLPLPGEGEVSTTEGDTKPPGRLILMTSSDHMPNAYKNLKPRWKMSYRTAHQMVGSKPISDLAPTTTGAAFVYGRIELPALEPGYVEHGRRRPKDGPVVEAIDRFASEQIKALAKQISDRRRENLDERSLDELHEENRKLDEFKNRFLRADGAGSGGSGQDGQGPKGRTPSPGPDYGSEPDNIELAVPSPAFRVGIGVPLHLETILAVRVQDVLGRLVPHQELTWFSAAPHVANFSGGDVLTPRAKGHTTVHAQIVGTGIESARIPIDVWAVDHVLLTPRDLDIPLGKRERLTAEVTNDDGDRATDVYLRWSHDADDPLIVRIRPSGWVTGNRVGMTQITAGAGDPFGDGVWARIPVKVRVLPNRDEPDRGGGFPRLLLTGRDVDPATDEVREGDPDAPCLWQEPTDFIHNVWWLNLQSPEAAFAFGQRAHDTPLWRTFHVQKLMEMVTQILMQEEFTSKGEDERQAYWADHKLALDRYEVHTIQQMWEALHQYVTSGDGLD
jgi:hypothetical protein